MAKKPDEKALKPGKKDSMQKQSSNPQNAHEGTPSRSASKPKSAPRRNTKDAEKIRELELRLQEAEDTLEAIRSGAVDALVISAPEGEQVYTLKGAEHPYRVFFEAMHEGAVVLSQIGMILASNKRFSSMVGDDQSNICGSSFFAYFSTDDRTKVNQLFNKLVQTRLYDAGMGANIQAFDGSITPVQLAMSLVPEANNAQVCIVVTDLSAQKRTEEELRRANDNLEAKVRERTAQLQSSAEELECQNEELRVMQDELMIRNSVLIQSDRLIKTAEERLRFALESSHIGAWDLNLLDHTAYRSLEHDRIFGYTDLLHQWTYEMFLAHVVPEDRAMVGDKFQAAINSQGDWNFECCIRRADGEVRRIMAIGRHQSTASDNSLHMAGIVQDVTERRRVEEALLKLNEELTARNLQLAEVNKEMEAFIYSVSHDLRGPLRNMKAFAGFLQEDYAESLDEQAKDYLSRIDGSAAKMSALIEDLLTLSRFSRGEIVRTDVDVSKLADSIICGLRETNPDRKVTVSLAAGLTASADASLMGILLQNLLENAWKYTAKSPAARIECGAINQDGKTVYYVKDNGVGFDPQKAKEMFQPFRRLHADREFEGTGIGLAIVERIILRHRGTVWAEGDVGSGAAVYFTVA